MPRPRPGWHYFAARGSSKVEEELAEEYEPCRGLWREIEELREGGPDQFLDFVRNLDSAPRSIGDRKLELSSVQPDDRLLVKQTLSPYQSFLVAAVECLLLDGEEEDRDLAERLRTLVRLEPWARYVGWLSLQEASPPPPKRVAEAEADAVREVLAEHPELPGELRSRIADALDGPGSRAYPPAWSRLELRQGAGGDLAILDGIEYRLHSPNDLLMLQMLQKEKGVPVLANHIEKELGERARRIYSRLPKPLQAIIERPGQGGAGYRML